MLAPGGMLQPDRRIKIRKLHSASSGPSREQQAQPYSHRIRPLISVTHRHRSADLQLRNDLDRWQLMTVTPIYLQLTYKLFTAAHILALFLPGFHMDMQSIPACDGCARRARDPGRLIRESCPQAHTAHVKSACIHMPLAIA